MENLKPKAKDFLNNAGYGKGSNYNTELIISLMARFAEKQVNDIKQYVIEPLVCTSCDSTNDVEPYCSKCIDDMF